MANLTGTGLAQFATSKINTPYVYGAKGADGVFTQSKLNNLAAQYPGYFTASYITKAKKYIGSVCTDCSGLISWYTGKVYGSAQLKEKASEVLKISEDMPVGTVVWKSGHVGVYVGDGYVVEAKGISYGTVKTKLSATAWVSGLKFSWLEYTEPVEEVNPYKEPTTNVKNGSSGTGVKWTQWQLNKAGGYKLDVDGKAGAKTVAAIVDFQKKHGLTADGISGKLTRAALKKY